METNNSPKVVTLSHLSAGAAVWGKPGDNVHYKLPAEPVKIPAVHAAKGWSVMRERRGGSSYPRTGAAVNAVHYLYQVSLNGRELYECKTMAQVLRVLVNH